MELVAICLARGADLVRVEVELMHCFVHFKLLLAAAFEVLDGEEFTLFVFAGVVLIECFTVWRPVYAERVRCLLGPYVAKPGV